MIRASIRAFQRVASACLVAAALADVAYPDEYPIDELILRVSEAGNLDSLAAEWGFTPIDSIPARGIYLVRLTNPAIQDSMAIELDGLPEADFCDYDYEGQSPEARHQIVIIAIGVSGTDVEDQGAMARVRKDEAHAYATGAGSRVALIDTGFDLDHPFLAGRFDLGAGADFVDGDSDPDDPADSLDNDGDGLADEGVGHGTMVAGIVATIAPDVQLIPIRVLDDEGNGTVFRVIKGLYHALDAGANIVNLSLGSQDDSDAIEATIEELLQRGVAVVAAGGNDSTQTIQYPARESAVIAITATDSQDVKADFANYSSDVDLSAPGVGILSSYRDGTFGLGLGTSFSAPFATGAVALMRDINPGASPEHFRDWLGQGAVDIDGIPQNEPWEGELGDGRIDCVSSIMAVMTATGVASRSSSGPAITGLTATPNPARDHARVRFSLERESEARLEVFSVEGRRVSVSLLGTRAAGMHEVPFPSEDSSGLRLASGHYVFRLVTPAGSRAGSISIIR